MDYISTTRDGSKKYNEAGRVIKNVLTNRTHSVKIIKLVEHDRRTSKSMSEMINGLPPSSGGNYSQRRIQQSIV